MIWPECGHGGNKRQAERASGGIHPADAPLRLRPAGPCGAERRRATQTPPPVLADPKAADLEAQRHAYQGLQDTLAQSEEQRKKIEAEIASYENDRAALTAALIDARKKIEEAEAAAGETQNRLDTLTGSEAAIQRSLASRRDVLIAGWRPCSAWAASRRPLCSPSRRTCCAPSAPRCCSARCCRSCARRRRRLPTTSRTWSRYAPRSRRNRPISPANWRRGATSARGWRR